MLVWFPQVTSHNSIWSHTFLLHPQAKKSLYFAEALLVGTAIPMCCMHSALPFPQDLFSAAVKAISHTAVQEAVPCNLASQQGKIQPVEEV